MVGLRPMSPVVIGRMCSKLPSDAREVSKMYPFDKILSFCSGAASDDSRRHLSPVEWIRLGLELILENHCYHRSLQHAVTVGSPSGRLWSLGLGVAQAIEQLVAGEARPTTASTTALRCGGNGGYFGARFGLTPKEDAGRVLSGGRTRRSVVVDRRGTRTRHNRIATVMATNDKYDRQLRLWGPIGQRNLAKSHVLLIQADAVGAETLKNLVLPGVGAFTILDDHRVTSEDLGNNFFVSVDAVGKPRAEVRQKPHPP